MGIDRQLREAIIKFQKNEISEYHIYSALAKSSKKPKNKQILEAIAQDELRHSQLWKGYTNEEVNHNHLKIWFYLTAGKIFGITFAIKLMENGERKAEANYLKVVETLPETKRIFDDENRHETELINLIHEEKLEYIGSIVLGLNDALVELIGALAGLSFALRNNKLIAMAALITGVAASMSMAGSEYLSKKAENDKKALKASIYTGITYICTVMLLTSPYLFFNNYVVSLTAALLIALVIITVFTFFTAVVKDLSFKNKFLEMAIISFGVAGISFLIGIYLRKFFNIEI